MKTYLPGIIVIEPEVHSDPRGHFLEMYHEKRYHEMGMTTAFVQDNLSHSIKGVLRGLHYQLNHPQGKLVSVIKGTIFDVAVDIRFRSPTFGQWMGIELSAENQKQLYIPPDFAHGFYVLSEEAIFHYKCTDYYYPQDEYGILWNDKEMNIQWPNIKNPLLSSKDQQFPLLNTIPPNNLPLGK